MVVPPAPVRVPDQRLLAPSVTSATSVANDKGDEMIPGTIHRSPGIYLSVEENCGKPQLGDRLMKAVRTCHRLKLGLLPPDEVSRLA